MRPGDSAIDDTGFQALWRGFRIFAGAVMVAALAGAMTLEHSWARHDKGYTRSATRPQPLPDDHLTGVGATLARFRATHGPALMHDGFGPVFPDNAGDEVPTYDIGNSTSSDIVDTLIHSFPAGTSEATVLAAAQAHDLPADAQLVRTSSPDRTCKVFTYRSASVAGSGPYVDFGDGTVTVRLYSHPSAPYTTADVQQAYEVVASTIAQC